MPDQPTTAPAPPPAAGPLRVSLLGSRAAGKTCFLAGLAVLGEPGREGPFQVHARAATKRRTDELAACLRARRWPPATARNDVFDLSVVLDGRVLDLRVLDYEGGDYTDDLRHLDRPSARNATLHDHFGRSDAMLLLFNPSDDLFAAPSAADRENLVRRQDAHLQAVREAWARGAGGAGRPAVAVVLTMADKVPGLSAPGAAREYFRRHAGALDAKLREFAGRVGYFAVSAVGATKEEGSPVPLPAPDLEPTGYAEVFRWVLARHDDRAYRTRRRLLKWGAVAAAALVVAAAGAFAYWSREGHAILDNSDAAVKERFDKSRGYENIVPGLGKKRWELAKEELKKLRERLAAAVSEKDAEDVRAKVKELLPAVPESARDGLNTLLAECDARNEQMLYNRVESAYRSQDRDFPDLARRYLRDYTASTPHRRQVDEWWREATRQDQLADRAAVKRTEAVNATTLRAKAERIQEYLGRWERHEDKADAGRMRRAADLALKFCAKQPYAVRLKRSGRFNTAWYTQRVRVDVGEEGVLQTQSSDCPTVRSRPRTTPYFRPA